MFLENSNTAFYMKYTWNILEKLPTCLFGDIYFMIINGGIFDILIIFSEYFNCINYVYGFEDQMFLKYNILQFSNTIGYSCCRLRYMLWYNWTLAVGFSLLTKIIIRAAQNNLNTISTYNIWL